MERRGIREEEDGALKTIEHGVNIPLQSLIQLKDHVFDDHYEIPSFMFHCS